MAFLSVSRNALELQDLLGISVTQLFLVLLIQLDRIEELSADRIGTKWIIDREHKPVDPDNFKRAFERRLGEVAAGRDINILVKVVRDALR